MSEDVDLIVPIIPTAADVRAKIDILRAESGVTLLEAIILYAETTGVEMEAIAPVIQGNMRQELEIEARALNLLKSAKDDPRGSQKPTSSS